MVLVEHPARMRDVEHVVGALLPRQRDDPVQIRAHDPGLGRHRRELAEAAKLAPRPRGDRLGQPFRLERRREVVAVVPFFASQLAVDRPQLLLEVELALVLEQ